MYMREVDSRYAARAAITTAATVMVMTCTRTTNNASSERACRWEGTITKWRIIVSTGSPELVTLHQCRYLKF